MTSKQLIQLKRLLENYTELELYNYENKDNIMQQITDKCCCMHCTEFKNGLCIQDIPF